MCGDLKPGHKAHYVVVRLQANESNTPIALGDQFDKVKEVWLTEYAIRAPNTAALVPDLWRISFDNGVATTVKSNAGGRGYPIVINNSSMTHVVYNTPRVVSTEQKGRWDWTRIVIQDENGASVTFSDATFFFTIVCEDSEWSVADAMNRLHSTPHIRSQPFDTRIV